MKIAVIIVRVLMGLIFLFASIVYVLVFYFKLFPIPEMTGDVKRFNEGMFAAVYLMPLVKIVEFLCGVAFVTGRFVPLAVVLISPIIINIFMFHAFLQPEGLPLASFLVLGNCFLAYANRDRYKPLLSIK
jgi:uncharacterized membrane protein YphA (DoxX/SURF4 family)